MKRPEYHEMNDQQIEAWRQAYAQYKSCATKRICIVGAIFIAFCILAKEAVTSWGYYPGWFFFFFVGVLLNVATFAFRSSDGYMLSPEGNESFSLRDYFNWRAGMAEFQSGAKEWAQHKTTVLVSVIGIAVAVMAGGFVTGILMFLALVLFISTILLCFAGLNRVWALLGHYLWFEHREEALKKMLAPRTTPHVRGASVELMPDASCSPPSSSAPSSEAPPR